MTDSLLPSMSLESRPKKAKPCPYCAQGIEVRNGQHWIVKSIIPARITIKECKAAKVGPRP